MAQPSTIKAIFLAAIKLEPADRASFISGAALDDVDLARLQALIAAYETISVAGVIPSPVDASMSGSALSDGIPTPAPIPPTALPVPPSMPSNLQAFTLRALLGEGGMGMVFLAWDAKLWRDVAVKVLKANGDPDRESLQRIQTEAQFAAGLNHENVVRVYSIETDRNPAYIVYEYVAGVTLESMIVAERARRGPATASGEIRAGHRRAAAIVAGIADGLERVHRANIIHRDVKPANVLVDDQTVPHLTDFGIAARLADSTRDSGPVMASVPYMSPERARGAGVATDTRSDIFSLGVVLYELLALKRPFDGADPGATLQRITSSEPADLKLLGSLVHRDLRTICGKMLEKEPGNRYSRAGHVAADLRSYLEGAPIMAHPPGLGRRLRFWTKRRRTPLMIALLTVLVAISSSLWYLNRRLENARRGLIVMPRSMDGATVQFSILSRPVDGETDPLPRRPRTAPFELRLPPGLYLLKIKFPGGGSAEAVSLIKAGYTDVVEVNPCSKEDVQSLTSMTEGTYLLGPVHVGSTDAAKPVTVQTFAISPTEVSNADYYAFYQARKDAIAARGGELSAPAYWKTPYESTDDHLPVANISWDDANEYCRWKGLRMLTPQEWEAAARTGDGRPQPWGASAPTGILTASKSALDYRTYVEPVGARTDLCTPTHLHHMASNVQEMTSGVAWDRNGGLIVKGRSWADSEQWLLQHEGQFPERIFRAPNRGFRTGISLPQE